MRKYHPLKRTLQIFAASALSIFLSSQTVFAQEEWSAKSNPSSTKAKMIDRYQQLVDRSPEESYAFKQMLKTAGKGQEFDRIIAEYEEKVIKNPTDFNLNMILGHLYKNANDNARAVDQYKKASEIKKTPLVYESLATIEDANKNYQEAIQYYQEVLKLSTEKDQKDRILRALVGIELHRRHLVEANKYLTQLTDLDPNSVFLRRELAQTLSQNRLYAEALEQLMIAQKLTSNNEQARIQIQLEIAELYVLQDEDDKALEIYQQIAEKMTPQHWAQREVFQKIVDIYRKKGDIEPLLKFYTEKWKSPTYDQVLLLADLYDEAGQNEKSIQLLKSAVNTQPSNPDAHEKYIAQLLAQGDQEKLIDAYNYRIKHIPRNDDYRFELAEFFYKNRQEKDAFTVLQKAAVDFKNSDDTLLRIADKYSQWNLTDNAIEILTKLTKKNPHNTEYIELLGETLYQAGFKKQAKSTWGSIAKIAGDPVENAELLAKIYTEHNMFQEAVELYQQLLKKKPKNCQALRSLADISERRRDYNEALSNWSNVQKYCKENPMQRESLTRIVRIYESQGILAQKLTEFEQNFDKDPSDLQNGFFLASAFATAKDYAGNIRILKKMHQQFPNNEDALFALQQAYANSQNQAEAIQILQTITQGKSTQKREAYLSLAELHSSAGDFDRAEKSLLQALQLNANDAIIHEKLSNLYKKLKNYDKAAYYAEIAADIDPSNYERAFNLATIYAMLGRDEEADKIYIQIILNANDPTIIQKASNRAIDYHDYLGTLEGLAKTLYPVRKKTKNADVYQSLYMRICDTLAMPYIMQLKAYLLHNPATARFKLRELGVSFSTVIVAALSSKNQATQLRAIELAPLLGISTALPKLASFVEASNRTLQVQAALSVAQFHSPNAVVYLKKWLGSQYDRRIREIATWGLGLIPTQPARQALLDATTIQFDSIRALGLIGLARQRQNSTHILTFLKTDPSALVQNTAAWAAAYLKDQNALNDVYSLLQRTTIPSLSLLWAARTFDTSEKSLSIPYLYKKLWSSDSEARSIAQKMLHANNALIDLAEPTLWEVNSEFINLNDSSNLINSAFNVQGLLDEFVRQSIEQSVQTHQTVLYNPYFAESVTTILESHENTEKQLLLKDLCTTASTLQPLTSADEETLAFTIKQIQSQLRSSIQKSTTDIQFYALQCFEPSSNDDIKLVSNLFKDTKNPAVRLKSAEILAKHNTEDSNRVLLSATASGDSLIQTAAIEALGRQLNPENKQVFINALQNKNSLVAITAANALHNLNQEADNPLFIHAFHNNHSAPFQIAILKILSARKQFESISKLSSKNPIVQQKIHQLSSKS